MSTYGNYLYNESTDTFYILVYKLGSGSYSNVWFTLEIENFHSKIKNKKSLKINPRALKIHHEECYEQGETEIEVNKYIIVNKKKSQYINYPLSSFIYDDTNFIVVYEVAIGSLYDVMKIFNKELPLEFVDSIIPQIIESIKFIHQCKFIHTDIKPENYLLMGLDKLQKDIVEYSLGYNLGEKLKKMSNLKKIKNKDFEDKMILDQLNKFLKLLSIKFGLDNNILTNSDDSDDSDEDNNHSQSDNISIASSTHSFYSVISDESKEEDYETVSSYDSRDDEYELSIDNFHLDKLIKILFNKDSDKYNKLQKQNKKIDNLNKQNKILEQKQIYLKERYFSNPVVKLTDFGTMIRFGETNGTIQTRYYRSPEIILGNKFNEKIDVWSLGCTIYELITGKILFYTCKDTMINKYDVDLIHIRMIFEKIEPEQQKILLKLIYKSSRKKNFVNNNGCLNFFKEIDNKVWIQDFINLDANKETNKLSSQVKSIISNFLNINPKNRNLEY